MALENWRGAGGGNLRVQHFLCQPSISSTSTWGGEQFSKIGDFLWIMNPTECIVMFGCLFLNFYRQVVKLSVKVGKSIMQFVTYLLPV